MSFPRAKRFNESTGDETPGPGQYDVNMDFFKGFDLRHKISRSPRFSKWFSRKPREETSSSSSSDDRSSTRSQYFGNVKLYPFNDHTGEKQLVYSPNLHYLEQLHQKYIKTRRFAKINKLLNTGREIATKHHTMFNSSYVENENMIEDRTKPEGKSRTNYEKRSKKDCPLDIEIPSTSNSSVNRDEYMINTESQNSNLESDWYSDTEATTTFDSSDDEEEYINEIRTKSKIHPILQDRFHSTCFSYSTVNQNSPISLDDDTSSDVEGEYMHEIRIKPENKNSRFISSRFSDGAVVNVWSVKQRASISCTERFVPQTEINISVNCEPASFRPQLVVNGNRLNTNKKSDVMQKIENLQDIVDRNKREITKIQELLQDLHRTIDAMEIHD